jgi:hypothetical protein
MKYEGTFKVTKRSKGRISGKVSLDGLISNCLMEFSINDPQSVQDAGKIVIEIPDVKKPEPPKMEAPKKAELKK